MSNFINRILVFLHLRKKREGGFICANDTRPFWDFQMFDIPDHNNNPWYVDAYYTVWRFFHYGWGSPRQVYREILWLFQRGRRGWADCDTWNLDDYLSRMLPGALTYLKEHKHGVPCSVIEPEDCGEDGQPTPEGLERAEARWNAIMDKMIAGFKADRKAQEGLYEDELGAYPMRRPSGVSAYAWEKVKHDRHEAIKALTERDRKIAEEGMLLFIKHWGSLWD